MFEKKSSIDKPLLFLLLALFAVGLTALYSAGGEARFLSTIGARRRRHFIHVYPVPTQSTLASKRLRYLFSCRVTGAFCRAWLWR